MKKCFYLFLIFSITNIEAMLNSVDNLIGAISVRNVAQCRNILSNITLSKANKIRCLKTLEEHKAHGRNWENYNLLYNISKLPLQLSAIGTAICSIANVLAYFVPKKKK